MLSTLIGRILANVSTPGASSKACLEGDPLCSHLELPPAEASQPSSPPATDTSIPPTHSSEGNSETAPPKAPSSTVREEDADVSSRETGGNWEYNFDLDGISAWERLSETVRALPRPKKPDVRCLDSYIKALGQEGQTPASAKAAFREMLKCRDRCITDTDIEFLSGCIDWDTLYGDHTIVFKAADRLMTSASHLLGYERNPRPEAELASMNESFRDEILLESYVKLSCSDEETERAITEGRYSGGGLDETPEGECREPIEFPLRPLRSLVIENRAGRRIIPKSEVVYGDKHVFHIGNGEYADTSACAATIDEYPLKGLLYFFSFEVLEDNASVYVDINRICGIDFGSNFMTIHKPGEGDLYRVSLQRGMSSFQARPLQLSKGSYVIVLESGPQHGRWGNDIEDMIVGDIHIYSDKDLKTGAVWSSDGAKIFTNGE